MPVYEYKGWDAQGKKAQGLVDAESPKSARLKLKKDGVYASDVVERRLKPQRAWKIDISGIFKGKSENVSGAEISIATRQMSTLVGANLPIVSALNALMEQVENESLKAVFADVREKVNEGASFADALAAHPRIFGDLYVNMVRAGETGGALEIVLERLADFLENQNKLRNKIVAALIYPVIMLIIGSGVLTFMITYVIPQVRTIFDETNRALPLPTQLLLGITSFITSWWWTFIPVIAGGAFAFRRFIKTDVGRKRFDGYLLRAPLFGNLILLIAISRFTRTLATLLTSGITLIKSLDIVKHVVGNVLIKDAIENSRDLISEGSNFADPLKQSRLFPPIVTHMVAVGEKTGELEDMLKRVADAYDTEVETKIVALTSIMEPIMIVGMGVVIGFVVVAVLLPIFQMAQGL